MSSNDARVLEAARRYAVATERFAEAAAQAKLRLLEMEGACEALQEELRRYNKSASERVPAALRKVERCLAEPVPQVIERNPKCLVLN